MMVVLPVYYEQEGRAEGGRGEEGVAMQIFRCAFEFRKKLCERKGIEARRERFKFS